MIFKDKCSEIFVQKYSNNIQLSKLPQNEYEYQYSEENIRIYLNIRAYTGPWAAVGGGHRPILYGGGSDRWRQLMALVGGNGEKTCNKICST